MKIRDVMTNSVVQIDPEESVAVAARMLTHYNIGAMPVCSENGRLWGMVTDRDMVTRCLASGRSAEMTPVRDVMSGNPVYATPEMEADEAVRLMGARQIRRLPVLEAGKVCGMVSLGDLSGMENAGNALNQISNNVSSRK